MLIGELAKQTGLSKDTIRFYEKMGLIAARDRQAGSRRYKEYGHETVERLTLIVQGKGLGFTLREIKPLLDQWEGGAMSQQDQIRVIEGKVHEINEKMRQLSTIKTYLINKLELLTQDLEAAS
ncbi:MerR family transcriptional regulator [Nodosilinea sp. E11]|uniref:MerR family transcriptional regulator n=1 Tax=Nodosilinea sp. E11 TaxID=3037479 RepID=UPI002934B061|nr:MerR family transcriptional regulator [Nodosilinea sp. E11]WOD38030.1 MerR family transcriptional regulator [Nodosilinea sp. E11]